MCRSWYLIQQMQGKKLTRVKDIVAENISSLYKTAIAEIARKDAQCKELQSRCAPSLLQPLANSPLLIQILILLALAWLCASVILLQAGGRATR